MNKKKSRLRRANRTRIKILSKNKVRLCVHKTPRHIYAQVISGNGSEVIVSASTVEKSIKQGLKYCGNIYAAESVGKEIAKRAIDKGITKVVFDRSGFKYHGRVKSLATSARESGLIF